MSFTTHKIFEVKHKIMSVNIIYIDELHLVLGLALPIKNPVQLYTGFFIFNSLFVGAKKLLFICLPWGQNRAYKPINQS
jgi:hypothetical protein